MKAALLAAGLLAAGAAQAQPGGSTGFDAGAEGWSGSGRTWIAPLRGDERPALRTRFEDFGIWFSNDSNPAFVGDYTALTGVTIGLDVNVRRIDFGGASVTRELVVELRDHDAPPDGYDYVSVWAVLGTLDPGVKGWTHLEVTIDQTLVKPLPAGWGGYGAEDPVTFEPVLPADRTFASVLAGVDEIVFTTLKPGWVYGFTKFDLLVDNLSVTPVPEAPSALLAAAGLGLLWARRRRPTPQ